MRRRTFDCSAECMEASDKPCTCHNAEINRLRVILTEVCIVSTATIVIVESRSHVLDGERRTDDGDKRICAEVLWEQLKKWVQHGKDAASGN